MREYDGREVSESRQDKLEMFFSGSYCHDLLNLCEPVIMMTILPSCISCLHAAADVEALIMCNGVRQDLLWGSTRDDSWDFQ